MNIGRLFVISDWSSDCHWDFIDEGTGDNYKDFFSIATVDRKTCPGVFILMICLGPICLVFGLVPKGEDASLDRSQDSP